MTCERELITRQKATIEALQARIDYMARSQAVSDKSIRELVRQGAEFQEEVRQLRLRMSKIAKEAANG